MRSAAAAGLALAALAAAPGVANAAVAVDVNKPCYAEGDEIDVNGSGFTPEGDVRLTLERATGEVLETSTDPTAGPDGSLAGGYVVKDETGWFGPTQTRFQMTMRTVDVTREQAGQPASSPDVGATTSFIFSRWNVGIRAVGGRIHPARPVSINALGFTTSIRRPLFAHWMRNGTRVHTRRLGVLRGPCGDLRTRLSRGFPFRPVRPGRYEVRFSPSRTNTRRSAITHRAARVTRRIP
ncbi:MAG TPA: hypothetical protein VGW10_03705 [Solirubrobacteraceae bacterium]|nr:hypothetical protein [Solirubrobacteraceae bacterium]